MTFKILDAYLSTISPESFEVRVITSSPPPVVFKHDVEEVSASPNKSEGGKYFFRFQRDGLPADSPFLVTITQEGDHRTLESRTLPRPRGRHRLRFGILADPHLNTGSCRGGRRLLDQANELCEKYLQRMAELGAGFVILPGDILDSGRPEELKAAKRIIDTAPIPCHPMIGNHEPWSDSPEAFYGAFDLPPGGFRAFTAGGVRFILLSTPDLDALDGGTRQLQWLEEELWSHKENTLIFSHFSLILHPCVQGWKNDGLQVLDNSKEVLGLLKRHPQVKAFIAGHKNVPSLILQDDIAHVLCPQLIQAPCAFDIIDLYDGGLVRTVHEIDEQHLLQRSRVAGGEEWWVERFGDEESRNFVLRFPG